MIQIQQQLAHLNTVRESLDIISNALNSLKDGGTNIDLSSVISKIEEQTAELASKIDSIDITNLAKEETLNQVKDKLDNLDVDVDLREISKQGNNPEATNTKILEETLKVSDAQAQIDQLLAIQLQTIIGNDNT